MKKHPIIISILAILVLAPVLGMFVPALDAILPLAIAFHMPTDGPPFSEGLLPVAAIASMLVGSAGIVQIILTSGRKGDVLKVYCYFMVAYTVLALCIWALFFGSRFVIYFPIVDFGFYAQALILVAPHLIWLTFLFAALRHLERLATNE